MDCIYTEIPGSFSHIIKGLLIGQIQGMVLTVRKTKLSDFKRVSSIIPSSSFAWSRICSEIFLRRGSMIEIHVFIA